MQSLQVGLGQKSDQVAQNGKEYGKLESHDDKRNQRTDRLTADNQVPALSRENGQCETRKKSEDTTPPYWFSA